MKNKSEEEKQRLARNVYVMLEDDNKAFERAATAIVVETELSTFVRVHKVTTYVGDLLDKGYSFSDAFMQAKQLVNRLFPKPKDPIPVKELREDFDERTRAGFLPVVLNILKNRHPILVVWVDDCPANEVVLVDMIYRTFDQMKSLAVMEAVQEVDEGLEFHELLKTFPDHISGVSKQLTELYDQAKKLQDPEKLLGFFAELAKAYIRVISLQDRCDEKLKLAAEGIGITVDEYVSGMVQNAVDIMNDLHSKGQLFSSRGRKKIENHLRASLKPHSGRMKPIPIPVKKSLSPQVAQAAVETVRAANSDRPVPSDADDVTEEIEVDVDLDGQ